MLAACESSLPQYALLLIATSLTKRLQCGLDCAGDDISPLIHLYLPGARGDNEEENDKLHEIVSQVRV